MKTKTWTSLSIMIMMVAFTLTAKGTPVINLDDDNTTIIIRQVSTEDLGGPRMPETVPFYAELMEASNSVLLGATSSCGIVSVQITSTAGDNYFTGFDTSTGAILLPISGNAGDYTLTITMPGGAVYVGEFSI